MEQPYIMKKQVYALILLFIIILIGHINHINNNILLGLFLYFIVVLGITFIPSIPRIIKYPKFVQVFLYELPMWGPIHLVECRFWIEAKDFIFWFIIEICIIFILIYMAKEEFLSSINNVRNKVPISGKDFCVEIFGAIFALISEEVFFRVFLVGYFVDIFGWKTILISSLLFTISHYLNRWANKLFTAKIYLFQFLFGFCVGWIYYVSESLVLICLGHFLFNISDIIILLKRLKAGNKKGDSLFDDYI